MRTLAFAVAVISILVFARTLGAEFLGWDDDLHVTGNARLDPPTFESVASFWTAPFLGLYVPASYTLFALESWVAGGPDPRVFHAVSVLLHAGSAALVVVLVARLGARPVGAALGGLLFALHPLQVESVAWISEQRGLLAACFGLGALVAYARPIRSARGDVIAFALLVLALLAKPSAVVVPALALLVEVAILRRGVRFAAPRLAIGFAAAAVILVITRSLQADDAVKASVDFPARFLVAADALEFYARKLVAPVGLVVDHGRRPDLVVAHGVDWTLVATAAIVVVALIVPRVRRVVILPGAISVAALAPVLGLVPFAHQAISTVADRYAYLALLGPALLVARLWPERPAFALRVGAVVATLVLGALSFVQAAHWRDTEAVFERVLVVNPRSWIAHTNRGLARQTRGDLAAAAIEYEAALAAKPDHARALNNLGLLLVQRGQAAEGEALVRRAIDADPLYPRPHMNLAAMRANQGRHAEAEVSARRAVELAPLDPTMWSTLGGVLLRQGRASEAREAFARTVELRPRDVEGWIGLGQADEALDRRAEAIANFERALELARERSPGRVRAIQAELDRLKSR